MKQFKNILVSVNSAEENTAVLELAALLGKHNNARLKLVTVVHDLPWHVRLAMTNKDEHYQAVISERQKQLEALAAPLRDQGITVATRAIRGQSSVGITREVLRDGHDLVIRVNKGSTSRRGGFFGATSLQLLRKCPASVWIVKQDSHPEFHRVVGALDLSHDEQHVSLDGEIIELARDIAQSEKGGHAFIHAWTVYGEQMLRPRMSSEEWQALVARTEKEVNSKFNRCFAEFKLSSEDDNVHLIQGEPTTSIPSFVADNETELLIMGTVGRSGLAGMIMGNTAEMILDRVKCPVLALKPKSFVSPITLEEPVEGGSIQLGEVTP